MGVKAKSVCAFPLWRKVVFSQITNSHLIITANIIYYLFNFTILSLVLNVIIYT